MKFAKDPERFPWLRNEAVCLNEAVKHAGITVLIGTSGQGGCVGCFTQDVIEEVAKNTERPVILPLSNPIAVIEALPSDIYNWTNGRALVATGSPFEPYVLNEETHGTAHCSNALIFPGVGLGILASGAREVLPSFFTAAAHAVSDFLSKECMDEGRLVPKVGMLSEVSQKVALAVAMCAVREGVSRPCVYSRFKHENDEARMKELINKMRWKPDYLPLIAM